MATLIVRPRGWHKKEKLVTLDDQPVPASLFDFGLFSFHNAKTLIGQGTAPYFHLPKMESRKEARLWNAITLKMGSGSPGGPFAPRPCSKP